MERKINFCTNCGNAINEDNGVCPHCGADLVAPEPQSSPEPAFSVMQLRGAYNRAGLALLGVLGAMTFASLLFTGVLLADHDLILSDNLTMFLNSVIVDFIAIPAGMLLLKSLPHSAPPKANLGAGNVLRLLVISFFLLYTGAYIGNFAVYLLPWEVANPVDQMILDTSVWMDILCVVLIAPLFEELLFRKFLLDRLLRYGERTAIFATALAFGLFHANIYQFFYAFALGLVLGFVYCRSGKLWLCFGMHAIINFVGSIVAVWANTNETAILLYSYGVWVLIILGLIFGIRDLRRRRFSVGRCPIAKPNRYVYGNAGMIIFIVYTILLTLYSLLPAGLVASLLYT